MGESTWYNSSNQNAAVNGGTDGGITNPPSTDQFLNPHIITSYGGGIEHIHVSYYDSKDKSIKYRYNRRGDPNLDFGSNNQGTNAVAFGATRNATGIGTGGNNEGGHTTLTAGNNANYIPRAWTNLDGGVDGEDTTALAATGPYVAVAQNARVVRWTNSLAGTRTARGANNVGEHNAIAVTRGGFPVIAYYDAGNQRLKLAVSRNIMPVAAADWVIRDNVIPAGGLRSGTGQFVSIAIDTQTGTNNPDIIHMAAMNANGNLVYIKGDLYPARGTANSLHTDTTAPANNVLVNVTVQVVDSVAVGRWCKISLDSAGNPWIAYQDTGYIGSRDGVKLAYLNQILFPKGRTTFSGQDTDRYSISISGWETMHVPTNSRVENPISGTGELGRIGLECYPMRNYTRTDNNAITWTAAVSYLSTYPNNKYRIAYYQQ
jgi:hypothetical protein